ncbi:leukocyte receptor cluster member 8 isoform X7 [Cervus elaphus]|uniref:leukocyte receptor cluster member 8 isoform X7 n=1 Tax=Cervus elaphus TaxID=9860 RepID=UPI001CC30919|nr:leukocyte receptor cluster member 8 isoform X7 [Cervus elaphus]
MAANVGDQRSTDWSSQYSMVAGAGRENGMETPMHENPEWEKARQALASISKAGAAGSSAKASSNGPVASAQYVSQAEASALQQQQYYQWYQQYSYAYPYGYYYPVQSVYQSYGSPSQYSMASSYGSAAPQHQGPLSQRPLPPQPPVPGMDEGMPYQAPPQQLPAAQPPQPANPPHGAHPLSSGPQPGTAPATQHSQAGPASGQAYGQHTYSEPAKPKKGQQLWNRMKRSLGVTRRADEVLAQVWGLLPNRLCMPALRQGEPVWEAGRLAAGHEGVRGALLHGLRVRGGQGPHGEAAQGGAAGAATGWLGLHHRLEPRAPARADSGACGREPKEEAVGGTQHPPSSQGGSLRDQGWGCPVPARDAGGWRCRPSPRQQLRQVRQPQRLHEGPQLLLQHRLPLPLLLPLPHPPLPPQRLALGFREFLLRQRVSPCGPQEPTPEGPGRPGGPHGPGPGPGTAGQEARPGAHQAQPQEAGSPGVRGAGARAEETEAGGALPARTLAPPAPGAPGAAGGEPGGWRGRPRLAGAADRGHLPGRHQALPAPHLCSRPVHRAPSAGSEEVAVHGQVPLEGEAGLRLCLRTDEVYPAGPHGAGCAHRVHGGGVRDPRAHRSGEGGPRRVQPVPDAAQVAVRREPAGQRGRVHRLPDPLLHLH